MTKGLRIVRGYVQIRLMVKGAVYHKNFGPDSPLAREYALKHLLEKRHEVRMGKFGITKELPSRKFMEVANEYADKWEKERNPDGSLAHNSSETVRGFIRGSLGLYFGGMAFDAIRPLDVVKWREKRLKAVLGTSVNREQAVLSSIFSHVEDWVKNEEWPAMKLPRDPASGAAMNPCASVEKAPSRKRKRVLSILELKALKEACYALKDQDMWEICGMALKSLLRKKDLFLLETSGSVDIIQSKTQVALNLPVNSKGPLNFKNFRKRWEEVRRSARLEFSLPDGRIDQERTPQMRDLRKTGANLLKMKKHSRQMISEFLGHANLATTDIYMVKDADHLKPLAKDLEDILEGL